MLEKYAVREPAAGIIIDSVYDGIMIKDNHGSMRFYF